MDSASFFKLLTIIGILFLLMVTGYICRKIGWIDEVSSKKLSKLIICLGQPMMIVGALLSKDFGWELLREGLFYTAIGFIIHPVMALFAFLSGKAYKDLNERKISEFATIFTNCGFIGFPILEAVFPGKGAFYGAFFVIGFHLYIWTLGILILSQGREDIRLTPKKALINFGTVPCAIGLILYLCKSFAPDVLLSNTSVITRFCNYLGDLCMPISVLVTGSLLATQSFGKLLRNPRLYYFNIIKLLVVPLCVCLLTKLVTLEMEDSYSTILFCTVIAALPSAATVTMLSEMYGIDSGFAAQTVGSSSVLSLGTLPLLYFLGDLIARI